MLNNLHGRQARPASPGWNVLKTLVQLVVFWSTFLCILPAGVLYLEELAGLDGWRFTSTAGSCCGATLFALASLLGLTSAAVMATRCDGTPLPADCPRKLVLVGPYRYIRNPMALAGITQGIAVGIFLGSPAVIVYAFLGGPGWNYLIRPWEEADLEQRFGESYRRYRAAVWCWLPSFPGYRAIDESTALSQEPERSASQARLPNPRPPR